TGFFFFSSRRRHTRSKRDWSSDVCSSDLSPAEKSHKIIVYLARIPTPRTKPATGQAHFLRRHIAWKPKTNAQHQQQVKGASMVRSEERRVGKEGCARRRPQIGRAR